MSVVESEKRLGELVAEHPCYADVFERLGLDYCCGGKQTLDAACATRGLQIGSVLDQLHAREALDQTPAIDPAAMSMTELCDHIEQTHHAYLRAELPFLQQLLAKVVDRRKDVHPELVGVQRAFELLESELVPHMFKEERVLFPMIRQLERASDLPMFHCGSIGNPIGMMEMEHDTTSVAIGRIRHLTNGYVAPEDACTSFRTLYERLAHFEVDMRSHIHKENNVLFPRALARQAELSS
jgi:regulator of cell morphogenesis and NO signaling